MFDASPEEVFAAEFFIVVAINAWGAMQNGYAPWPPTIVMMCLAIAILLFVSILDARLSEILGIGLLLGLILMNLQSAFSKGEDSRISKVFGAVPPDDMLAQYDVLRMPS